MLTYKYFKLDFYPINLSYFKLKRFYALDLKIRNFGSTIAVDKKTLANKILKLEPLCNRTDIRGSRGPGEII